MIYTREEVNAEKRRSSNATDQLKQSHQSELKELQKEMSRNQQVEWIVMIINFLSNYPFQSLRSSLHQAHQLQLEEAQSANQLAVKLLREELERQRQQENRELMLCHTAEMSESININITTKINNVPFLQMLSKWSYKNNTRQI